MNYNQCTIIGRLAADPELSHTQSGVPVCKLRVAVNRIQSAEARAQGVQQEADFFDVSAWRQSGEYAAQYLRNIALEIAFDLGPIVSSMPCRPGALLCRARGMRGPSTFLS